MKNLIPLSKRFAQSESGSTAVEYAMIAGGVVLALLAPLALMGENIDQVYQQIASYFADMS